MNDICDVIIVGGGGSGLTAAIYTARADLKTLLFERDTTGGQIAKTDLVENFPGFPEGITGAEIAMKMEEQALKQGAKVEYQEVVSFAKNDNLFEVKTASGLYSSKALIFASGATPRLINVKGEAEFSGKGVSYCATCDAPFFRNKIVIVVGGGDSAVQEALFLAKFAKKVYIVHRRDKLRAGYVLCKRAEDEPKISFIWNSVVDEIMGSKTVEKVRLKDVKEDVFNEVEVDGVFVFIGHDPSSALLKDSVDSDESGYIMTNESLESSLPGLFVCGELRAGAVWQLVAACGEGCQAALSVQHYLENLK